VKNKGFFKNYNIIVTKNETLSVKIQKILKAFSIYVIIIMEILYYWR
jgi:hypothetical protein